jgi:hypothetical protein
MLKTCFPQPPRTARCGKPLLLWFSRVSGCTAVSGPAATNRRARHSMSEDRTPSGRRTVGVRGIASLSDCAVLSFAVQVWQVGQRRRPVSTNRVARHSMSKDRAPSREVRFASETNSQMSSARRLFYKAFDEAKPPVQSQPAERNYVD